MYRNPYDYRYLTDLEKMQNRYKSFVVSRELKKMDMSEENKDYFYYDSRGFHRNGNMDRNGTYYGYDGYDKTVLDSMIGAQF